MRETPLSGTVASRVERGTRRRDFSLCRTRNRLRKKASLSRIIPGIGDLAPRILSRHICRVPDVAGHVASPCQLQCQRIRDGREAEVLNDGLGSNCDLRHPSALCLVPGAFPT